MATYKDTLLLVDKVTAPLQKITKKMTDTQKAGSKLQSKFTALNNKMQNLAPTSVKVLGAVGKLTKSFVGLVGASGALTMGIKAAAAYGDRIDKMSQKIGMGQKAFQEWDYIMSQNGGSVETLQMGFKTLTTQIEGVQKGSKDSIKAFRDLGVSVKDSNGKFRNQDDIFNDVVRALQKIQNPTKKAMLANRLFGRSAAELRPLLNQEADAIDGLRAKANKLGLIMSPEDVKNAVEFTDTMDTLGRFFQARINVGVTKIMPKLVKIFEDLMAFQKPIDAIFRTLGKVVELTFGFIGFLGKHWEILVGIGTALLAIAAPVIWSGIVTGITAVTAAITSGAAMANIAMAGIPILIGLIVTGITLLITHWDKVKEVAAKIGQAIANTWSMLVEKFKGWISTLMGWVDKLLEKFGVLANFIPGLRGMKIAKDIAGAISGNKTNNDNRSIMTNSNNTTTSNTYNTTNNYNSMFPLANAQYFAPSL